MLAPFQEIPKFKHDLRENTLHCATNTTGLSFILKVNAPMRDQFSSKKTPKNITNRVFLKNNIYTNDTTKEKLLHNFWIYQPVRFMTNETPTIPKEKIVFDGNISFSIWKIETETVWKTITQDTSYCTSAVEFDYIEPITLDWFFKNMEMLKEYKILTHKEKEDIGKYYDLRKQIFNY